MNIFLTAHIDILRHLLEKKVEFLLIGGYAVIYHGYQRTTGDMDLWINPSNENKIKLIRALEAAGFESDDLEQLSGMDFTQHLAFSVGDDPQRIDFINNINQVSFEDAEHKKVEIQFEGLKIPVLNINDLILSKINTGRKKDEADVEELQKIINIKKR